MKEMNKNKKMKKMNKRKKKRKRKKRRKRRKKEKMKLQEKEEKKRKERKKKGIEVARKKIRLGDKIRSRAILGLHAYDMVLGHRFILPKVGGQGGRGSLLRT